MQDENIKGWQKGLFGKQVQNSALGTIKSKLKQSGRVIMLDRNLPTTKWCHKCGNIVTSLSQTEYSPVMYVVIVRTETLSQPRQ